MAWLLKYDINYNVIHPKNYQFFTHDELIKHLKTDDYCIYQLRGHDQKPTPYKIVYNPALMGELDKYNYLATKAILKPEFSPLQYEAIQIRLRSVPESVFQEYYNLTFIGGLAIVATVKQLIQP